MFIFYSNTNVKNIVLYFKGLYHENVSAKNEFITDVFKDIYYGKRPIFKLIKTE